MECRVVCLPTQPPQPPQPPCRVANCIRALAALYLPIYPAAINEAYEVWKGSAGAWGVYEVWKLCFEGHMENLDRDHEAYLSADLLSTFV